MVLAADERLPDKGDGFDGFNGGLDDTLLAETGRLSTPETPVAQPPPILVLIGPTASGKTRLAIELADALPGGGECIGADSMQIYRGMDIGTASPTAEERARVPHHLFDIADPAEEGFTVHDWLKHAEEAIAATQARGATPIIVGGTNLYVRALLEGVFQEPPAPDHVRQELEALPTDTLRERLENVDPVSADRIHRNDRRRTIRALEVHQVTGRRLSEHQTQWSSAIITPRRPARLICLDWPAEALNRRINARVKHMAECGLKDEVRRLLERHPLGRQAREAVGYREFQDVLEGRLSETEALERMKIRTRRYGKQQRTWIRRFHAIEGVIRLDYGIPEMPEQAAQIVMDHLQK